MGSHPLADTAALLEFFIPIFHAYGHKWGCQKKYNPRKRDGAALTDGEGSERNWAIFERYHNRFVAKLDIFPFYVKCVMATS